MNWSEIVWTIVLIAVIICVAIFSCDPDDAYAVDIIPNAGPKEITVNYVYTPTEGYENIDAIAPEDVVNLDEFEQIACMLAQTLYGECRGLSKYEQSLVCWTIFNRYDDGRFGDTLADVITAKNQFYGYSSHNPIDKELYSLAVDCLLRWQAEKYSVGDVGRTLPKEFLYFSGSKGHNWYRTAYKKAEAITFDFKGADPYRDRPF